MIIVHLAMTTMFFCSANLQKLVILTISSNGNRAAARDQPSVGARLAALTPCVLLATVVSAAEPWVVYDGFEGPGGGKHVVLVAGDEEYRSEEGLPQLGKILAKRHGFKCTVLFAIDPETGVINPDNTRNIPGLDALRSADLMIIATRFRDLPDEQMEHVAEYIDAGKPVIGMRAAVVAFRLTSPTYDRFSSRSRTWEGGFGRVL